MKFDGCQILNKIHYEDTKKLEDLGGGGRPAACVLSDWGRDDFLEKGFAGQVGGFGLTIFY